MRSSRDVADDTPEPQQGAPAPAAQYGLLDRLLGYPLRRAQLLVYDDFIRSLSPWDMTPPRFSALVIIAANPGLKLTELSNMLAIARSGSVILVDTLEQSGLVERRPSPTDKRAWGLHLTDHGQAVLTEVSETVEEHDRRISAALTDKERITLMRLLRKFAGMSGDVAVDPGRQAQ